MDAGGKDRAERGLTLGEIAEEAMVDGIMQGFEGRYALDPEDLGIVFI